MSTSAKTACANKVTSSFWVALSEGGRDTIQLKTLALLPAAQGWVRLPRAGPGTSPAAHLRLKKPTSGEGKKILPDTICPTPTILPSHSESMH